MPYLSKSNIVNGQTILDSQVSQLVDAFTYSSSYDLLINGAVSIGTGSLVPDVKVFISGSAQVVGTVTATSFTGSFTGSYSGSGAGLTGVVSSSYALSATTAPLYLPTASYLTDSASFDSRIRTVTGSSVDTSSFVRTSSFNAHVTDFNTFTGSYTTDSASFDSRISGISTDRIKSGNNGLLFVFGNNVYLTGSAVATFNVSGSATLSQTVTAQGFVQSSLRSLKENIKPFTENAVDIINTVNVVSYTYKRMPHIDKVGIIADDTHEILSGKEKNYIDTGNAIGLLLKAVQELSTELKELKKQK